MLNKVNEVTLRMQHVLEKLYEKGLLPFRLTAHKVECIGEGESIVRFHDSRLHSVDLSWQSGQCFEEVFRAAVVARVDRLNDSFRSTKAKHNTRSIGRSLPPVFPIGVLQNAI